jgi:hypothetical protein
MFPELNVDLKGESMDGGVVHTARWSGAGSVLAALLLIVTAFGCGSKTTAAQRDAIARRLVATHLPADRTREVATVYATRSPVAAGIEIAPAAHATDPRQAAPTYTLAKESWFFAIDTNSLARFAHPVIFVFVPTDGSADEVHHERWWPVIEGQRTWFRQGHMEAPPENIVFEGVIAASWRANGRQP